MAKHSGVFRPQSRSLTRMSNAKIADLARPDVPIMMTCSSIERASGRLTECVPMLGCCFVPTM
jgi:hypothetical protein